MLQTNIYTSNSQPVSIVPVTSLWNTFAQKIIMQHLC